jgi:hypothetical protein
MCIILNDQINLFLNHAEYFDTIPICGKSVIGNLRKNIDYWKSIGASEFIIDTIEHSYVVPFQNVPPPMKFKIINLHLIMLILLMMQFQIF